MIIFQSALNSNSFPWPQCTVCAEMLLLSNRESDEEAHCLVEAAVQCNYDDDEFQISGSHKFPKLNKLTSVVWSGIEERNMSLWPNHAL